MRKGPEAFTQLCDFLIVDPSYKMAARDLRVSEQTIFRWLQESQQKPAEYTFSWGDSVGPLHIHVRSAMKMNSHVIEGQARKFSLDGFDAPVFFGGKQQWVECEIKAQCPGDLDWYMMVDGCRDPYKRDADGNRIPLTAKQKPSDALVLAVLKAYMPKMYGNEINHTVSHGGHVMVVGVPKDVKQVPAEPRVIEHMQEPLEDRLQSIRERMLEDAQAHLSDPTRVTRPNAPVQINPARLDDIQDKPRVASRAQPAPGVEPQPPKRPEAYRPPYARQATPGSGVQGTGAGPDPNFVGGSRGFPMNPPRR
jgi:hypothetical protein